MVDIRSHEKAHLDAAILVLAIVDDAASSRSSHM